MANDMWKKYKMPIIIGAVLLVLVGWVAGTYNSFIGLNQGVLAKWSEVENQYQRQADLIPNLVSTLQNYQQFEKGTLTEITGLRTQWQSAATDLEKDTVGVQMTNSLGRLIATFEGYPDLKTITAVSSLMDELSGTQNRISVARGRYIEAVQGYNSAIKYFPGNLLAGMFGFTEKQYYTAQSLTTPNVGELLSK